MLIVMQQERDVPGLVMTDVQTFMAEPIHGRCPAPEFDGQLTAAQELSRAVESNVPWTVRQILETPEGRARVAEGRMKIVGAVYEIETGRAVAAGGRTDLTHRHNLMPISRRRDATPLQREYRFRRSAAWTRRWPARRTPPGLLDLSPIAAPTHGEVEWGRRIRRGT
jgi:hypothetical protein